VAAFRIERHPLTITFAGTLGELGVDEFLGNIWGQTFAHLPGARGRFRELLPWSEVNAMLQRHRLEPPRLRLVRKGEFAPKTSYLRYEGAKVPFVVPEKLSQQLRDGYTLIIDAVDDMVPGVMQLAEDFERVLHEGVQVNLYAGWREQQGFHRHCDTHDVIVLQVYGKKYWRVYEGGRLHPLRDDIEPNQVAPEQVVWEGLLEDGDVLYIPRGWWHEASGVGDVTLHLTFGIHQRTGVNLLHWVTDQLRTSTEFRAPLRRFGSAEEQEQQLDELRRQLRAAVDGDLFGRYFTHQNTRARSRGWASLPWSVADEVPPLTAQVALAVPRGLDVVRDNGSIRFDAHGKTWKFDAATEPLLRTLERGPATVAELCAATPESLDAPAVQQFVTELARNGLVTLR
jgi:ribosomal protein L16 Arg81 hydroxylase